MSIIQPSSTWSQVVTGPTKIRIIGSQHIHQDWPTPSSLLFSLYRLEPICASIIDCPVVGVDGKLNLCKSMYITNETSIKQHMSMHPFGFVLFFKCHHYLASCSSTPQSSLSNCCQVNSPPQPALSHMQNRGINNLLNNFIPYWTWQNNNTKCWIFLQRKNRF